MDPLLGTLTTAALRAASQPLMNSAVTAIARRTGRQPELQAAIEDMLRKSQRWPGHAMVSAIDRQPPEVDGKHIREILEDYAVSGYLRQLHAANVLNETGIINRTKDLMESYVYDSIVAEVERSRGPSQYRDFTLFRRYAEAIVREANSTARSIAIAFVDAVSSPRESQEWAYRHLAEAITGSLDPFFESVKQTAPLMHTYTNVLKGYESVYREAHAYMLLPDLHARRMVKIEDYYVEPQVTNVANVGSQLGRIQGKLAAQPFSIEAGVAHRAVILGDPGAGKSTSTQYFSLLDWASGHVPFYVVLRKISIGRDGFHLVGAICERLQKAYQVTLPEAVVERLLLDGRAVVYLDGLDELLDPRLRTAAAQSVEAAALRYPATRMVVTSRVVGYDECRLSPVHFQELRIQPLSPPSIEAYVTQWFQLSEGISREEAARITTRFMAQAESIGDLAQNPLLLAFICVMYRGRNYIPKHRPELFRNMARLLLREWDLKRGVVDDVSDLELGFRALAHVATIIMRQRADSRGLSGEELKKEIAGYLISVEPMMADVAREAAAEVVELCSGRGWMFTDMGLHGEAERFDFTHASFREYFAAVYLVRHIEDSDEVSKMLEETVASGQNQIMLEVTLSLMHEQSHSRANRVFTDLLRIWITRGGAKSIFGTLVEASEGIGLSREALHLLVRAGFVDTCRGGLSALPLLDIGYKYSAAVADYLDEELTRSLSLTVTEAEALIEVPWNLLHFNYIATLGDEFVAVAERFRTKAALLATKILGEGANLPNLVQLRSMAGIGTGEFGRWSAVSQESGALFLDVRPGAGFGPPSVFAWIVDSLVEQPRALFHSRAAIARLRSIGAWMSSNKTPLEVEVPVPLATVSLSRVAAAVERLAAYDAAVQSGFLGMAWINQELRARQGQADGEEGLRYLTNLLADENVHRQVREDVLAAVSDLEWVEPVVSL